MEGFCLSFSVVIDLRIGVFDGLLILEDRFWATPALRWFVVYTWLWSESDCIPSTSENVVRGGAGVKPHIFGEGAWKRRSFSQRCLEVT